MVVWTPSVSVCSRGSPATAGVGRWLGMGPLGGRLAAPAGLSFDH